MPTSDQKRNSLDNNSRSSSKDGRKKNIWSSMLDNAATGKRLPEKNLLILGGTTDTQKEFLETFSADTSDPSLSNGKRKGKLPPVANQFALGYTYLDVLDADQEDTLARVSAYLLSEPSLSFAPLLKPLLTPQSIPETLVVILLDWSDPWTWIRRLREWVRLLRHVLISLDDETKLAMEENITEWRDRKRAIDTAAAGQATSSGGPVTIPLGPGEWDEGLGIPLCVVCQGADKMEKLERDHGWHEEEFDFILQFLRTLLLKHGASLIYTTPFLANSLQSLLHSCLGIHSLLKRQSLKANVIDRDKILVPPNWDSWGKIRILREGFDMEGVSTAWSIEIQDPPEPLTNGLDEALKEDTFPTDDATSAVAVFEQTIKDPKSDTSLAHAGSQQGGNKIEIETSDMQSFLSKQLEILEQLKIEDDKERAAKKSAQPETTVAPIEDNTKVSDHIGPVQFNMGGIQVDADDMLRKLKEREASRSQRKEPVSTPGDEKAHNQALANFFAGLVKKPGGSPRQSPSR
ncbi:dynein light intermediate chain-domain-containing protein [Aspergillus egyptiacus]|nr:dynein light intermediate chain-domain-containing protein [Aspergillus egyptiacus]